MDTNKTFSCGISILYMALYCPRLKSNVCYWFSTIQAVFTHNRMYVMKNYLTVGEILKQLFSQYNHTARKGNTAQDMQ